MKRSTLICAVLTANLVSYGSASIASELVYTPLHPAFGGDTNYFNSLFTMAQTQNKFVSSSSGGDSSGVPEINFPPITIDLGGVGTPAAPEPIAETPTPAAKQTTARRVKRDYLLLELNE